LQKGKEKTFQSKHKTKNCKNIMKDLVLFSTTKKTRSFEEYTCNQEKQKLLQLFWKKPRLQNNKKLKAKALFKKFLI
jgi:hypothetical protein